jgi:hypothetical protein
LAARLGGTPALTMCGRAGETGSNSRPLPVAVRRFLLGAVLIDE